MLIVGLPQVHRRLLARQIIEHPLVGAVRYNTGVRQSYTPDETVQYIRDLAREAKKPAYIDLKGKQVRVDEWANLPEGPIILNHHIDVKLPAKVFFRGDKRAYKLCRVINGKEIFVDPIPQKPVGRGQAVNIITGKKGRLSISEGILDFDRGFIVASLSSGIARFMLSFVESWDDVRELEMEIDYVLDEHEIVMPEHYEVVLKVESQAGLEFVEETSEVNFVDGHYRLMAARDDLMIHIGVHNMPAALDLIIKKDPNAICASRLLLGLEETGAVSMADVSDLEYMRQLGYKHFMFSDTISQRHFRRAIAFWGKYVS